MGSGRRALRHATDTGRASSRAGAGKVEVEPPAVGPDHEFERTGRRSRVCQASLSFPPVIRSTRRPLAGLLVCVALVAAAARRARRGCRPSRPINPVAASRTPLGFEPYRTPRPGRWSRRAGARLRQRHRVRRSSPRARYDLDAEILRLRLRRRAGSRPRAFVELDAGVGGSYAGFLDGFLDWYHGLLGITLERARAAAAATRSCIGSSCPTASRSSRRSSGSSWATSALAAGIRLGRHLQTVASLTLPTSTAPGGLRPRRRGRRAWSPPCGRRSRSRSSTRAASAWATRRRTAISPPYQRTTFVSASSGLRWRFWGRQSLYGNLFVHIPYYHDTTIPRARPAGAGASISAGSWRRGAGREWRLGLTEDLEPGGPGIDLVFRLGVTR